MIKKSQKMGWGRVGRGWGRVGGVRGVGCGGERGWGGPWGAGVGLGRCLGGLGRGDGRTPVPILPMDSFFGP